MCCLQTAFPSIFTALDQRRGDGKSYQPVIAATMLILLFLDISRASDLFPNGDAETQVKAAKDWLASKGVRDFEPVSLFSDQLEKVRT